MSEVFSNVLFEVKQVSVLRIPPGEVRLQAWNLDESNIIWRGDMRLVEEEIVYDDEQDPVADHLELDSPKSMCTSPVSPARLGPRTPQEKLRLKLELFNSNKGSDLLWAEVWYIPILESDLTKNEDCYYVANNCQETIQVTPESHKYYKIIAQIPGTGCQLFLQSDHNLKEDQSLQVALGLKFWDSFSAISFAESLSLYRKRFRSFEEQYSYELQLLHIHEKYNSLSLGLQMEDFLRSGTTDEGQNDSDFGDFVEA